jgi:hypothetical protein
MVSPGSDVRGGAVSGQTARLLTRVVIRGILSVRLCVCEAEYAAAEHILVHLSGAAGKVSERPARKKHLVQEV